MKKGGASILVKVVVRIAHRSGRIYPTFILMRSHVVAEFTLLTALFIFILPPLWAEYMPGEVLLKFKPEITRSITAAAKVNVKEMLKVSEDKVSQLSRKCEVSIPEVKEVLEAIGVLHLKFPPDSDVLKIIEKYNADSDVEYAEPNYKRHIFVTPPDDTYYGQQWGLIKIKANDAWNITEGNTSIVVAVLDTGVDTDHEDLLDKLIPGRHFYNGVDENTNTVDDYGHGTHVAGIIGAITNNSKGVAGVSWYCRIMPVKVLDDSGSGWDSDVAKGIIYASDTASIINLSLGDTKGPSSTLQYAVNIARGKNRVVIAAAGNDGTTDKNYPAACDGVIAVGATDQNDNKASFSNYGDWITVVAPGSSIYSTMPNHTVTMNGPPYNASQNYAYLNGTSMATPFVSGVAALIFARYNPISGIDVELRLKRGVDDIGSPGKDDLYGYGRINAVKALGDFLTEVDPIKIYAYPNPLRFPEKTKVVIKNVPLTNKLTVKIYNIAGELVRQFTENDIGTTSDYAYIEWNGKNDINENVASGVYIVVISDGTRVATEKIMVIK